MKLSTKQQKSNIEKVKSNKKKFLTNNCYLKKKKRLELRKTNLRKKKF